MSIMMRRRPLCRAPAYRSRSCGHYTHAIQLRAANRVAVIVERVYWLILHPAMTVPMMMIDRVLLQIVSELIALLWLAAKQACGAYLSGQLKWI